MDSPTRHLRQWLSHNHVRDDHGNLQGEITIGPEENCQTIDRNITLVGAEVRR